MSDAKTKVAKKFRIRAWKLQISEALGLSAHCTVCHILYGHFLTEYLLIFLGILKPHTLTRSQNIEVVIQGSRESPLQTLGSESELLNNRCFLTFYFY